MPDKPIADTAAFRTVAAYTPDARALMDIVEERGNQNAKWGEQDHPDGTGAGSPLERHWRALADAARTICQDAAANGTLTWLHILREEVYEAFAEDDPAKLRHELVQAAAVITAWVGAIDRRTP